MTLWIWNVHGYVLMQKHDNLEDIPVQSRAVQEVEALVVGEEWICAVVEEEVDNIVVAALSRPQDRRCDGITALCVDGRAGLDKEVAEGVVVVDGSPLNTN